MTRAMDETELRTEQEDRISFVISLDYRVLVLGQLATSPEIPSQIDDDDQNTSLSSTSHEQSVNSVSEIWANSGFRTIKRNTDSMNRPNPANESCNGWHTRGPTSAAGCPLSHETL